MPASPSRNAVIQRILVLLFILLLVMFFYTFLHEGGHALLGLLFGGGIITFNVSFWDLSAHVNLVGDFSSWQQILISAAGVSLPLLVWLVFLLLTPLRPNPALDWLRTLSTAVSLNTLLAWIIIPFLYLAGNAPGDDTTKFLDLTGLPPLLVSAAALAVYRGGWRLFLRRSGRPAEIFSRFRQPDLSFASPPARRSLAGMALVGTVFLAVTLISNTYFARLAETGQMPDVPAGYSLVANLLLEGGDDPVEFSYPFTLDRPTAAAFFVVLQDVSVGPVQIALRGADGYEEIIFSTGANFNTGRSTFNPRDIALQPGDYRLEISVPANPGRITVYQRGID